MRALGVLLGAALLAACISAAAQTAPLSTGEQVWIPVKTSSLLGEKTLKLEATLYKPDGDGPFPLVLFSHGSTGNGAIPVKKTIRADRLAAWMRARGIAVLAPMRKGRGASEGAYEEAYTCDSGGVNYGVESAVADTDAALAYARALRFVDGKRIILVGVSRGGLLSTVYAGRRPQDVIAVVNFVGGWTGDRCTADFNSQFFRDAARTARAPMLWLYGENDRYFSAAAVRRYAESFEKAGGRIEFHLYPFAGDGHEIVLHSGIWKKDFDAFFDRLGLPQRAGTP